MEIYLGGAIAGFIMGAVDIGFMLKNKFKGGVNYPSRVWLMSLGCFVLNVVCWPIAILAECVSNEQVNEKIIKKLTGEKVEQMKINMILSKQNYKQGNEIIVLKEQIQELLHPETTKEPT